MSDGIELFSDDEGVLVVGERSAVDRFLDRAGLSARGREVSLGKVVEMLRVGTDVAEAASGIMEQSALYLKLTPESAKRLKEAGGLMKTKTKGISHAMLGKTGKDSLKWLQVVDGPASLLTNPAVLSGVGGLMSQFAQQAEAQELKALLVSIDEKLDDVRRSQRDSVLAKMRSSAAAIDEAMTIRAHGGDPATLWDKVTGVSETILTVQEEALLTLGALADKVVGKRKAGELKKVALEIERDAAIQIAVLARCFELQDEFRVVEIDHVFATAPQRLEGHRLGVAAAREQRRATVAEKTRGLMSQMDAAGDIANQHILLHAQAAHAVIDSLNSTAAFIADFHSPIGIESPREALNAIPWREALRNPQQRKTAGKEVGQKALVGAGAAGAIALSILAVITKNGPKPPTV